METSFTVVDSCNALVTAALTGDHALTQEALQTVDRANRDEVITFLAARCATMLESIAGEEGVGAEVYWQAILEGARE